MWSASASEERRGMSHSGAVGEAKRSRPGEALMRPGRLPVEEGRQKVCDVGPQGGLTWRR